jgi:PLP dependent protein
MNLSNSIVDRIAALRQQLPTTVRLIAVSKYTTPEAMAIAYQAGVRDFGESRVQDVPPKQAALAHLPGITWHLIGHLQSNKARKAVEIFDWIHSIDSLRLLQQVDRLALELGKQPNVCLQVKMQPDPHKHGWEVADLWQDWAAIAQCQQVQVRGLMTIAPLGLTPEQLTNLFTQVVNLRQQISKEFTVNLPELSMGMSEDYAFAVSAGTTMVRIGSKIFGALF